MTRSEFDRAKKLESKILNNQSDLKSLKSISRQQGPYLIMVFPNCSKCYIPYDVKDEVFNLIKKSYENQIAELQSEFDSMVQSE